jgi:hypothetical protein
MQTKRFAAIVFVLIFCSPVCLGQSNPVTIETGVTTELKPAKNNQRWGFVDRTGRFVVAPKYFAAWPFKEGLALVVTSGPWHPLGNESGDFRLARITYIDGSGREIRAPISVRRASSFSDGRAVVVPDKVMRIKGGCAKGGYLNTRGEWAIEPQFDDLSDFSEGLAAVNIGANCGMGGKWGYIDKDGRVAIPFDFLSAGQFSDGRACVERKQGESVVINRAGNVVVNEQCK